MGKNLISQFLAGKPVRLNQVPVGWSRSGRYGLLFSWFTRRKVLVNLEVVQDAQGVLVIEAYRRRRGVVAKIPHDTIFESECPSSLDTRPKRKLWEVVTEMYKEEIAAFPKAPPQVNVGITKSGDFFRGERLPEFEATRREVEPALFRGDHLRPSNTFQGHLILPVEGGLLRFTRHESRLKKGTYRLRLEDAPDKHELSRYGKVTIWIKPNGSGPMLEELSSSFMLAGYLRQALLEESAEKQFA